MWVQVAFGQGRTSVFIQSDGSGVSGVEVYLNKSKSFHRSDKKGRLVFEDFKEDEVAWIFKSGYKYTSQLIVAGVENTIELPLLSNQLQEVVISDLHEGPSLEESVMNVRKISTEQLEAQSAQSIEQALVHQAYLRQNRDAALNTNTLKIMGLGGENVKVLVDGVPMIGRMLGSLDLNDISSTGIAGIEIIEGPMSVIYGSNALAGAINISTKSAFSESVSGRVSAYTASDGTYNFGGSFNKKLRKNAVQLQAGRNFFSGWNATDLSRGWDWLPKEQYYGNFKVERKTKAWNASFSSRLNRSFLLDRGEGILPYGEQAIDRTYTRFRHDHLLNLDWKASEKSSLRLLANQNNFSQIKNTYAKNLVSLEEQLVPQRTEQDTQRFVAAGMKLIGNHEFSKKTTLLFGVDANWESLSGERIEDRMQENQELAAYTSFEQLIGKLRIRVGLRRALMNQQVTPWIYALQTRLQVRKNWTLRASFGSAYRLPSIKESYLYFFDSNHSVYGNPRLTSEQGYSAQLRSNFLFKVGKSDNNLDLSFFLNRINDKIELLSLSPLEGTYRNIGKFASQGFTASHTFNLEALSLQSTYNLTGVDFGDGFQYSSRLSFMLSHLWEKPQIRWAVNWSANLNSYLSIYDAEEDEVRQLRQNGFSMGDVQASRKFLNRHLNVGLGVRNLLNVTEALQSNRAGIHSSGNGNTFISNGRTVFINLVLDVSK